MMLKSFDSTFPIEKQIAVETGPVVLLNVFTVDKDEEQALLEAWHADSQFMKKQPGFISAQLHRSVGEGCSFVNYAVWESTAHFRAAFLHPEFRAHISTYPSSAVAYPHLFQKVAVDGVCVA
jgi:heme-degrading monooxygenase HmoA